MTPKQLRNAFWAKKAQIDAIQAQVAPLRVKYDALVAQQKAALDPLITQIKTLEAPLFDMKNELGDLVRSLAGATAPQPGDDK